MSMPFDTLKLARRLEGAGFPPKQAGDMSEAIAEALSSLATKADIATLRADITTLASKADLAVLETKLTLRFGGMIAVAVGIVLAGFKFIH